MQMIFEDHVVKLSHIDHFSAFLALVKVLFLRVV